MTDLINNIDFNLTFDNNTVRVVGTHEDPYFIVADICKILTISNPSDVIKNIPDKWKASIQSRGGNSTGLQTFNTVNEAGLYKIIMRSKKKIAEKFQEWVCEDVLPNLRKKGEYKMNESYQLKLKQLEKEGEELRTQLEDKKTELDIYKKYNKSRKYNDKKAGDAVYLYIYDKSEDNNVFKIGKTKDINKREGQYNSMNKHGDILHIRYCYNCDLTEKVLHHFFDKFRINHIQEVFKFPSLEFAVKSLDTVIYFLDAHMETVEEFVPKLYDIFNLPINENIVDTTDIEDDCIKIPDVVMKPDNRTKTEEEKKATKESRELRRIALKKDRKIIKKEEKRLVEKIVKSTLVPTITQENYGRKTPRNFDKFIEEFCVVGEDFVCIRADLRDAYRIWSNCTTSDVKKELDSYLNTRFKTGVKFYNNIRKNIYKGVAVKLFVYTPSSNNLDYEQFIQEKCKTYYTYRISFADFYKYFEEWKKEKTPSFKLKKEYKQIIKEDLILKFGYGRVQVESESFKSPSLTGLWGIGMEFNGYGCKEPPRRNKKVGKYDSNTGELLEEFDSIMLASNKTEIPASTLQYNIQYNKVIDNVFYKFI